MAHCDNCNSDVATRIQIKYWFNKETSIHEKTERCNQCASIPDTTPRDAMGNKVVGFPDGYSYATDAVHTSKREFAEHLKRNGLSQKDGNLKGKTKWR